ADAYYLPFTRFWELALGGLLAWTMNSMNDKELKVSPVTSTGLSAAGFALLLLSMVWFDKTTHFPGWWALMPTIGTVLVIFAGDHAWPNRTLLTNRWMVLIGIISY